MTHVSRLAPDPMHLWFGNTRVAIRVASADGADGLSVIEHWMPHGESPPLHIHRAEDEVFHILEGRYRFRVGDRDFEAGVGETMLAPKGVAHHFRVVSPNGGRCLTVTRGADFEQMVRAVSRPAREPGLPEQVTVDADAAERLFRLCAEHGIDLIGAPLS